MYSMKKIVLLICLSIAFVSCKKENPIAFSTKSYDYKSTINCEKENCTYVHIEIPFANGNENIVKPINDSVFSFVNNLLYFENDKKTNSYDTLAQRFIRQYDETSRVFPNETVAWEANIKTAHKNLSEHTYQMVWDYYIFTGGAHALQATKVFFFDLSTGKTIPTKDLFLNFHGFKTYAETEFKKQLNVKAIYSEAGFTFKDNAFDLPQNMYETKNEWILYYNPYEIAPYVLGASVVKLPKEKVQTFLNPIYFKN